jgi:amino acid transporter
MGGDMIIVAAGESKYPRRDLAPATRFIYLMPLFFYILLSFVVGFNINYGDPELPHPWLERNGGLSPFIIVLKSTRFHVLPDLVNSFFVISAYSGG